MLSIPYRRVRVLWEDPVYDNGNPMPATSIASIQPIRRMDDGYLVHEDIDKVVLGVHPLIHEGELWFDGRLVYPRRVVIKIVEG